MTAAGQACLGQRHCVKCVAQCSFTSPLSHRFYTGEPGQSGRRRAVRSPNSSPVRWTLQIWPQTGQGKDAPFWQSTKISNRWLSASKSRERWTVILNREAKTGLIFRSIFNGWHKPILHYNSSTRPHDQRRLHAKNEIIIQMSNMRCRHDS